MKRSKSMGNQSDGKGKGEEANGDGASEGKEEELPAVGENELKINVSLVSEAVKATKPADEKQQKSAGGMLLGLLRNPVYMFLVFALCGLYFVVTGIQFWATDYMVSELGVDLFVCQVAFVLVSLTGPLLGVFFGGWLVDKMGGYKDSSGKAMILTLRTCNLFGIGAVISAIPAALVPNFIVAMIFVWFVLFFGAALLPALNGVMISVVPEDARSIASSFTMFTYSIFGYALAPILCGIIAQNASLADGWRVVLLTSVIALLSSVGSYYSKKRQYEKHMLEHSRLQEGDDAESEHMDDDIEAGEGARERTISTDSTSSDKGLRVRAESELVGNYNFDDDLPEFNLKRRERRRSKTASGVLDVIGDVSSAASRSRCSLSITSFNLLGLGFGEENPPPSETSSSLQKHNSAPSNSHSRGGLSGLLSAEVFAIDETDEEEEEEEHEEEHDDEDNEEEEVNKEGVLDEDENASGSENESEDNDDDDDKNSAGTNKEGHTSDNQSGTDAVQEGNAAGEESGSENLISLDSGSETEKAEESKSGNADGDDDL
eukprot:g1478.t1